MKYLPAPDKSIYISKNWPFDTLETKEQVNTELDIWKKLQGIMGSANATIGNPTFIVHNPDFSMPFCPRCHFHNMFCFCPPQI
jgi:hypothetical protein